MGMYTMFRFTGQLKDCFVKDIERLNNEESYSWKDFAEKYDFAKNYAKLERANLIPFGYMSSYNQEKNPSTYRSIVYGLGSDDDYHYTWTFCCDIKNYCGEIETFLRDIAPNICCKFVAIEWFEENAFPKIYTFGEKIEDKLMDNKDNVAPVVHARWIVNRDYGDCTCSACRTVYEDNGETIPDYWSYCPHCGAKMDEETDHAN